jgi:hypothetical protein
VVACAKSETTFHSLTGTTATFKEEKQGGEHKMCITSDFKSTIAAIQELLDINDQLLVCSGCRFDDGHQAMSSTVNSCTTCGETLEWTLQSYVSGWLRGLLTKGLLGLDMEKGHTLTNFALLGEMLLALHGLQVGLEFPDHRELGDDTTYACESEKLMSKLSPRLLPWKVATLTMRATLRTWILRTWQP